MLQEEKIETNIISSIESQEEYLKREFPLLVGEFRIDFHDVGKNRFRINCWERNLEEDRVFYSNKISRSYYVILKIKDGAWEHKVII